VPGKASGGGAHPNNGTLVGQWGGAVVFDGGGAGTVVADDAAQVLHYWERARKVRWGQRKARRGAASGSPMKAGSGGVSGEIWERSEALVSKADGMIPGGTGEVAACLSAGEKEWSREESGTAADAF
jgi:hypothetical protein